MESIKKGDIVQLKSGGPQMTVEGTGLSGKIICAWFINNELKKNYFDSDALVKISQNTANVKESN